MSSNVLSKEDPSFWDPKKWGSKKSSLKKLTNGTICKFSKSCERLTPHGDVCYKILLNG